MIGCEDRWTVEDVAQASAVPLFRVRCTVHGTVAQSLDEYAARATLRDACLDVDSTHLAQG